MKNLEDIITTHKDFPQKGIDFKDVLEILQEHKVFKKLIIEIYDSYIIKNS